MASSIGDQGQILEHAFRTKKNNSLYIQSFYFQSSFQSLIAPESRSFIFSTSSYLAAYIICCTAAYPEIYSFAAICHVSASMQCTFHLVLSYVCFLRGPWFSHSQFRFALCPHIYVLPYIFIILICICSVFSTCSPTNDYIGASLAQKIYAIFQRQCFSIAINTFVLFLSHLTALSLVI